MALLPNGYDPQNLSDVLTGEANSATANLTDQYQQGRKRMVAQQAAGGRLMSGVSNYPLTDLDTSFTKAKSGIQDQLASSLASVPEEDWLNQNNFNRSYQLANFIGGLNKPNTLEEILAGIGGGAQLATMAASFA